MYTAPLAAVAAAWAPSRAGTAAVTAGTAAAAAPTAATLATVQTTISAIFFFTLCYIFMNCTCCGFTATLCFFLPLLHLSNFFFSWKFRNK